MEGIGMLRWILIGIAAYVLYRFLRGLRPLSPSKQTAQPKFSKTGEMVACAACGTYILKENVVKRGGELYCSDACREKKKGGENETVYRHR